MVKRLSTIAAIVLAVLAMPSAVYAQKDVTAADVWNQGAYRWFVSGTFDFGFLYLRPRIEAGWGRPHAIWFGVDAAPIVSTMALGGYGGIRAVLPWLEARVGARGFRSFDHNYLPIQNSYSLTDFNVAAGNATYMTVESEVRSSFRLGPGDVGLLASISHVSGMPAGTAVFEDSLHVIVNPSAIWRVRAGYSFFIASQIGRFSVTPVVELLGNPSRDAVIVRGGFLGTYLINKHLEIRGTFVVVLASPDSIGVVGGDFSELGLRFRWATGD